MTKTQRLKQSHARRASTNKAAAKRRVIRTHASKTMTKAERRKKTEAATKAVAKKLRDPKFLAARNAKISKGMKRAMKQRARNPFGNLNTGKDYIPAAIAYAREAVADTKAKKFGIWIRLAARRFLDDLDKAKAGSVSYTFNADEANKACRFIELLPHVEGNWDTPTITLVPAQIFFLVQLFGFRNETGGRRFTTALFAVARKNAKSTLAAAIMLYIMAEENEAGAQLYAAATTGDQAKVVWRVAKAMLEKCHDLQRHYAIEPRAQQIVRHSTTSFFKAINAKASTQDGLNPQAVTLDELHAHKTHDLLNVLTSASGARDNPLILYTTTEGYETPGPWPETRTFAQNILRGGFDADHFLALIYSVDEESKEFELKADDDFDETKYIKANPLYDTNPLLRKAIASLAAEAKMMPGKLAEFRIKRLNRQSAAAKAWVDLRKWKLCGGEVDLEFLKGYPCWGAFDLASTTDMVAWCLLWYVEGTWYVLVRYFVPSEAVKSRTERRSAPYQAWIDGGHLIQTEGDVVDYDEVERVVVNDCRMFSPIKIAYDPWNAQQFSNRLTTLGLELEIFVQGPKSYHPAMQAVEIAYTTQHLRHGGNPVLFWNAANVVPRYDVNLNMAPDRKRSADKIDGMAALFMAFGIAIREAGDDSNGFFDEPVVA